LRESSSSFQLLDWRARPEQLLLQLVELAGQQAAQLEVAVDHVVDHAQHQVGRAGRHARAAPRASALASAAAAGGEELAHLAVGRVHGQQHAVEDAKPTGLVSIASAPGAPARRPSSSIAATRRRRGAGTPAGRTTRCSRSATAAAC
jgi:hypothetical protein